jgi:hypothetical protein
MHFEGDSLTRAIRVFSKGTELFVPLVVFGSPAMHAFGFELQDPALPGRGVQIQLALVHSKQRKLLINN